MQPSGANCKLLRSPASKVGLSPFHLFTTKASAVMNWKRLSKSSAANPRFSEGTGTCWNELVWKHCDISICLSNNWVVFNKSRSLQARQSRDCSSWMKFTSQSSHKISRRTLSGSSVPKGYSLPCQVIGPIKPLRLSTPGYVLPFGKIISKTSWRRSAVLVPPFSPIPLLQYSVVNRQKRAPWLIGQGKRRLVCQAHEPYITNSKPWLDIFRWSSRMYEQTRIRECVMAIVRHRLRSFDEIGRWLVDSLECSAPGRNWIRSERTVQRRKFVAITRLSSLGLRI